MRNILLLGSPDSLFIRDFCTEVLNEGDMRVVILGKDYVGQYTDDYQQYNITVVKWPDFFLQGLMKNLNINIMGRYISNVGDLRQKIGFNDQIDAVFVHFVEPVHLAYFFPFWEKAKKRILVFWGDDILRVSDRKLRMLPLFLRQATSIVFMIRNQCEYFQTRMGHKYDDKIRILDFGNSILDRIDKIKSKYTKRQCKEKFGFPVNKIIIHVGYNAFKGQQHVNMMKSIVAWAQLSSSKGWIRKIKFIFHMSYGKEDDFDNYLDELKTIMKKEDLDYAFIESYLQSDELAMFRRTCDIFLYGQKTDARSASPLEYIYAGAEFICPCWIDNNYELLEWGNASFYKYKDFSDLINVFSKCLLECGEEFIKDYEKEIITQESKKIIRDAISWDSLAPKWRSLI